MRSKLIKYLKRLIPNNWLTPKNHQCSSFILTWQLLLVHLLENVGAHPVRLHYVMEQPVTSCYLRNNYIHKMFGSKRIEQRYRTCLLWFLSFKGGGWIM
jgi:hypothetical protein